MIKVCGPFVLKPIISAENDFEHEFLIAFKE